MQIQSSLAKQTPKYERLSNNIMDGIHGEGIAEIELATMSSLHSHNDFRLALLPHPCVHHNIYWATQNRHFTHLSQSKRMIGS